MREIGGFLDIELRGDNCFHTDALALNSCRNALRFYIQKSKMKVVYISYFTCSAVTEALQKESVEIRFYKIDYSFLPTDLPSVLEDNSCVLYVNYWGICNMQVNNLIEKYGNQLVVDSAQAFYYIPPKGIVSMNSARKFFGVPDGAFLYGVESNVNLPVHQSHQSFEHLLKRYELGASCAYNDYLKAEDIIDNLPIARISTLTKGLLSVSNFNAIKYVRRENFDCLHKYLHKYNKIDISRFYTDDCVPMVYPFRFNKAGLRDFLIKNKVFVATYWPNVFSWCSDVELESELARTIIPLPIDQRYNSEDMIGLVKLINEFDGEE